MAYHHLTSGSRQPFVMLTSVATLAMTLAALLSPLPMIPGLSFFHLFSSILVCTVTYLIWRWFIRPLEIRRQDDPLPTNEHRRLGPIPESFPTGWFRLCFSQDVPRGRPRSFPAFGSSLLVFRGAEDGKVHVLDPYCPHLGADLQDGKVVGDCVECPFHGWRFRGADGKCAHIPYSEAAVPAQAQVEAWAVRESHGMVMVWYDAIKRAPFWEVPFPSTCPTVIRSYSSRGAKTFRSRH